MILESSRDVRSLTGTPSARLKSSLQTLKQLSDRQEAESVIVELWRVAASIVAGWCEEKNGMLLDSLYGLPQAIRNCLCDTAVSHPAFESILESSHSVIQAIAPETRYRLFQTQRGWRYGIEIVARCLASSSVGHQESLAMQLVEILKRLSEEKVNITGVFDWVRQTLLVPFTGIAMHATLFVYSLQTFISGVVFHASMSKQYARYLTLNDGAILLGEDVVCGRDSAPTVTAFFDTLEEAVLGRDSNSVAAFPFFARCFIDRIVEQLPHQKRQDRLISKRQGMLFVSRLSGIILQVTQLQEHHIQSLSELMNVMERHQLYQPIGDHGFLQLQSLQSLTTTLLKSGVDEKRRKRRRLAFKEPRAETLKVLEICAALVRIDLRAVTPSLKELLVRIHASIDGVSVKQQLRDLMQRCSAARKWSDFVSAWMSALMESPIDPRTILDGFKEGTRSIPVLQIPQVLETVCNYAMPILTDGSRIPSQLGEVMLILTNAVVNSIRVTESNAVAICEKLSKLTPPFSVFKAVGAHNVLTSLLECGLSISRVFMKCNQFHPEATGHCLESMEIESLLMKGVSHSLAIRILLDRLMFVHRQKMQRQYSAAPSSQDVETGRRVAAVIFQLRLGMTKSERGQIDVEILTHFLVPWASFSQPESLIQFCQSILMDFTSDAAVLSRIFSDPRILTISPLTCAFRSALLQTVLSEIKTCHEFSFKHVGTPTKQCNRIRKLLKKCMKLKSSPEIRCDQKRVTELLSLVKFGLEQSVVLEVFGNDRLKLECQSVILGTLIQSPLFLECARLFSLESLSQTSDDRTAHYFITVHRWMVHHSEHLLKDDRMNDPDVLLLVEEASFAILKQALVSQWSLHPENFFVPSEPPTGDGRNTCTAAGLISSFLDKDWKHQPPHSVCLKMTCVGVFVQLSTSLCHVKNHQRIPCLRGASPPMWNERTRMLLKQKNGIPDFDQLPCFLQSTLLPILHEGLAYHRRRQQSKKDSWRLILISIFSGILADIASVSIDGIREELQSMLFEMIAEIQSAASAPCWPSFERFRLDRIAHFLHVVVTLTDMESVGDDFITGLTRLLLQLFCRATEIDRNCPDFLQQPFLLAIASGEIIFGGNTTTLPWRSALLNVFSHLLTVIPRKSSFRMGEAILHTLHQTDSLASHFGSLQFLLIWLHKHRSFLSDSHKKLPGVYMTRLYRRFWDHYFRLVFIAFAHSDQDLQISLPTSEQTGAFVALLCGYLRFFTLCHSISDSLPQRITIRITRRIKKIIEILHRQAVYSALSIGASWFGEMCEFLISAVRHQNTAEAAAVLFPSVRSSLESMLSLLLLWKLQSTPEDASILEKAEAKLGAVYSETTSCRCFADTLPELLHSFVSTLEILKTRKSSSKNPLSTFFKQSNLESGIREAVPLERVHHHVSSIYAALSPAQIRQLQEWIDESGSMAECLVSLRGLSEGFTGHDG